MNSGQTPALPHIFLGLSTHDHRVHGRFMFSALATVAANKYKITFSNISSGGIHKARNKLAWEFLTKTDAEWYLSVDSDISWHPDNIARLLSHGKKVIGACYCHKKPQLEWAARSIVGVETDPVTLLQEMSGTGTGFLLVHRSVFETIREQRPEIAHYEDWNEGIGQTMWDFFQEGVVTEPGYYDKPTFLTEDFGFCKMVRDAGFKVYIDTTFYVMHWEAGRGYPEAPPAMSGSPTPELTVPEPVEIP